jgi:hypothetical protein
LERSRLAVKRPKRWRAAAHPEVNRRNGIRL